MADYRNNYRNSPAGRRAYGPGPTLAEMPFVNPLTRITGFGVANPWANAVPNAGPMNIFMQQAARARGVAPPPMIAKPGVAPAKAPPQAPLWDRIKQSGQSLYDLGTIGPNPLQEVFNWANAPQRPDEPKISALLRNGGAPFAGPQPFKPGLLNRMQQDVAKFYEELGRTPNDQERISQQVFASMIKAEGGTDKNGNFLTSPKGAVGPAQVMPGTAPEAAKLAGLPWDEKRYRTDPAYNQAIGYAYFKEKLRENNGDYAKAVAAYNTGQGNVQKAMARSAQSGNPWQSHVVGETQNYLQKVLGNMPQMAAAFGAPAPGFNAAPYQNAMQAQTDAANMLSQPYSATFTETPLPDRPAPVEFAAPDFTEGDAAFAATAPKNPFDDPKERRRMQWNGYAKGIGQALASLSGNEGIGTMLMKIGGMALAGRKQGDEQIIAREAEFEDRLAQYNRALAAREDGQAATLANVMNQNIAQRNQYADQIWQDNVKQIQSKNPIVSGDKLVTYEKPDPKDPNTWKMTVTPLGNAIQAEALINRANIGIQMGQASAESARFAYTAQQTSARTALGLTVQSALQANTAEGAQAGAEGYAILGAQNARAAVQTGSWRDMFGNDTSGLTTMLENSAKRKAYEAMGNLRPMKNPADPNEIPQPKIPLSGSEMNSFNQHFEDALTANIFHIVAKSGTMDKLVNSPTGARARVSQQSGSMRTTVRSGPKGSTTTQSWEIE